MYSIGRFASIGRVTVRMLRHWDEIGLLAPAHVDPGSGYRSYAPEQLTDLEEIVRLRDLGLGLVDIGVARRAGVDTPVARRLLESARDELRRSVAVDTADESGDGSGVLVTAGFELEDDATEVPGLDVHVLPAVEKAAVATHHGAMDRIDVSWMALVDRVKASGAVLSDACREVYL